MYPRGILVSGSEFDDKTCKAMSVCSTRVGDSGRASSSKKSNLRVPSSECSEFTEMTAMHSEKLQMTPMGILLGHEFGSEGSRRGPAVAAVRSLTRSGRVARKFSRHIVERVQRRRLTARSAARRMPGLLAPTEKPLLTVHVKGLSLARAQAALERTDNSPLLNFLEEAFQCSNFSTTDWMHSSDTGNAKIRHSSYTMPVPGDIPDVVARLLRVPDTIRGTTVWRMHADSRELVLVQHTQTKDVLYGDRFKLQNTMSVVEEPTGGVMVSTWTDVVWATPLPWTHGMIKHVIEKKAKTDSAAVFGQLVHMIEEAAAEE